MEQVMLTTIDNPYNPFTQFDEWYAFDHSKGYFSCEYLARIAVTSNEMSDEEVNEAINDAINEIIYNNPLLIYQKVTPSTFDSMKQKALSKEQEESLKALNEAESIETIEETLNEVDSTN